ncbi:MAG: sorbosone dehydrogenase family protein [Dehalococcoidia bacterium]
MIRSARPLGPLVVVLAVAVLGACGDDGHLASEEVFGGRVFDLAVDLVPLPDGAYLLAQQSGEVLRVREDGDAEVILDLSGAIATGHEELGLLAVAPDPGFDRTGAYFVHYTAPSPLRNVVARYTLGSTEGQTILEVIQPFENHNGGAMRFGPDGMLYVSFGDGGAAWDPLEYGQDPLTLLGSVIRLDVTSEPGAYLVPDDNPFVDTRPGEPGGLPEVWAYGVRNTWRFEFDEATGELWGGDVGQNDAEEVNVLRAGHNYGWSAFEGPECRVESCEGVDAIPPVAWYSHADGCAIVGGFVYRGTELPVTGDYLYADLCRGTIWALETEEPSALPRIVGEIEPPIVGFARGRHGEVLVLRQGQPIVRLVAD